MGRLFNINQQLIHLERVKLLSSELPSNLLGKRKKEALESFYIKRKTELINEKDKTKLNNSNYE